MTARIPRVCVAACAFVTLSIAATPARAEPTKAQCIDANAQAQKLRRESKLTAALQQLEICSDASCPAIVRSDCTARLDEVQKAQPTLVLDVKSRAGDDLTDVKVTMDGELFATKLDGTALPVNPGQHTFGFEAQGFEPLSKVFVLKETEKGRRERIVLRPSVSAAATPTTESPSPLPDLPPTTDQSSSGFGAQRWLGVITGGVGVAGIAVGSVFGLMASSQWSAQQSACGSPTNCPNHSGAVADHSNVTTDGTISTWTFIGGGVLLAAGAALFLTAPSHSASPSSALVVSPGVGPGLAAVELTGSF